MKTSCFLVIDSGGIDRMTKRLPVVGPYEFAVKVNLIVPDSVFRKTIPVVDVSVPETAVLYAEDIKADI